MRNLLAELRKGATKKIKIPTLQTEEEKKKVEIVTKLSFI